MQNTETESETSSDIYEPLISTLDEPEFIEISFETTLEDDGIEHLMNTYTRDIIDVLYSLAEENINTDNGESTNTNTSNTNLNPFSYEHINSSSISYIPLEVPDTQITQENTPRSNRNIELFADLNYGLHVPYEELSPTNESPEFFQDTEQRLLHLRLKIPKICNSAITKMYRKLNVNSMSLETFDLIKTIIYSKVYEILRKSIIIKPDDVKTLNIEHVQKAIQLTDDKFYNCF